MCQCVERASIDEAFIDLTDVVEKRLSQPVSVGQLPNTFVVGFTPSDVNDNGKFIFVHRHKKFLILTDNFRYLPTELIKKMTFSQIQVFQNIYAQ